MTDASALHRLEEAEAELYDLQTKRVTAVARLHGLELYIDEHAHDAPAFARAKMEIEAARTEKERLEALIARASTAVRSAEVDRRKERFAEAMTDAGDATVRMRTAAEAFAAAAAPMLGAAKRLGDAVALDREARLNMCLASSEALAGTPPFDYQAPHRNAVAHASEALRAAGFATVPSALWDLIADSKLETKIAVLAKDPKAAPFPVAGGVMVSSEEKATIDLASLHIRGAGFVKALFEDQRLVLLPVTEGQERPGLGVTAA